MAIVTVQLETPVCRTFRVEQVAGMLDLPIEERLNYTLTADVPGVEEAWTIGAIVGPSGCGKTTLARAAFGDAVYEARAWPRERAIVEVLGDGNEASGSEQDYFSLVLGDCVGIKQIARVLSAVGLGSVPTWLKPYHVLSTGERFRADLARALLAGAKMHTPRRRGANEKQGDDLLASAPLREALLVVDEFTSTLDRLTARCASAAVGRFLRQAPERREFPPGGCGRLRLVAVTCHEDVLPWLAPDWVVKLGEAVSATGGPAGAALWGSALRTGDESLSSAGGRCVWGGQHRPRIELRVERVPQAMWRHFAPHHYLSGGLAASATCYGAWCEDGIYAKNQREWTAPVAFCAVVGSLGWKKTKRITRLVVLPPFQGLGIGARLLETVASMEAAGGNRVTITASHPAILAHCARSPRWRYLGVKKQGSTRQRMAGREVRSSAGRAVAAFEFGGFR